MLFGPSACRRVKAPVSIVAILLITANPATIVSADAAETKGYVVSWLTQAGYSEDGDCPKGSESTIDKMYRHILAQQGRSEKEIEDLMKEFNGGGMGPRLRDAIIYRGRFNGQPVNVYQNPESFPDPKLPTHIGKYALGFDLDGKAPPNSYVNPPLKNGKTADNKPLLVEQLLTHEQGIDNNYFKVMGCISTHRVPLPDHGQHWAYTWGQSRESQPAWLITVTGEDLAHDGPVAVTFYRAMEHAERDASSNVRRDMTYRTRPSLDTRHSFHGNIQGGVLTIEPAPFFMSGDPFGGVVEYDITNTHLRLTLMPNGTLDGLLGGYQDWQEIYYFYGSSPLHESMVGINVPGVYYALKKWADADPDPKTGQNRRISVAYRLEAVPAFVVQPDELAAQRAAQ